MAHKLDASLARRCANGDRDALDELVEQHYSAVLNFIYRFLGSRDEAQDLAQEVFLKVMPALKRFDGRSSLRTWLFTIAGNSARDALRRRRRQRRVTVDEDPEQPVAELPDQSESGAPEVGATRAERSRLVQRAVEQLPDAHRMAVVLRFYHELSLQEIADICGVGVGTVGSRLHYAMKKLQVIVSDDPEFCEEFGPAEGGPGS